MSRGEDFEGRDRDEKLTAAFAFLPYAIPGDFPRSIPVWPMGGAWTEAPRRRGRKRRLSK